MSNELKRIFLVVGGFFIGVLYVYSPYLIEAINNCSIISDYVTCKGSYLDIYTPLYISYWIPFGVLFFPIIGLVIGVIISKKSVKENEGEGLSEKELSIICFLILVALSLLTDIF